jgi:hypothetical protein
LVGEEDRRCYFEEEVRKVAIYGLPHLRQISSLIGVRYERIHKARMMAADLEPDSGLKKQTIEGLD